MKTFFIFLTCNIRFHEKPFEDLGSLCLNLKQTRNLFSKRLQSLYQFIIFLLNILFLDAKLLTIKIYINKYLQIDKLFD